MRAQPRAAGPQGSPLVLEPVAVKDAREEIALDELALLPGGLAQAPGREPVEITHAAGGGLVEHGDCVVGEDVAVAAGALHPIAQVLGGVLGRERVDVQAPVDARVQGSVPPELELVLQLGRTDEDEGEERLRVPAPPQRRSPTRRSRGSSTGARAAP